METALNKFSIMTEMCYTFRSIDTMTEIFSPALELLERYLLRIDLRIYKYVMRPPQLYNLYLVKINFIFKIVLFVFLKIVWCWQWSRIQCKH